VNGREWKTTLVLKLSTNHLQIRHAHQKG
jgi:hypothetical protein